MHMLSINRKFSAIYYSILGRLGTEIVVVHSTAGKTAAGAISWFSNPKNKYKSSAHYVIDTDGAIYQLLNEEVVAWHAGLSHWAGHDNVNKWSIGIEVACEEKGVYTEAQLDTLFKLVIDIVQRHKIKLENVVRHSDVSTAKPPKRDPFQSNIDWDAFINKLHMTLDIPIKKPLQAYEEDVFEFVKSKENAANALLHDTKGFIEEMTPYKVLIAVINSSPVLQQEYSAFVHARHLPPH